MAQRAEPDSGTVLFLLIIFGAGEGVVLTIEKGLSFVLLIS
jgi:hypothetical protein